MATSLSAGLIVRDILAKAGILGTGASKIFPVAVDQAELPYIVYRRNGLEQNPTKTGYPGADTAKIEVLCCTKTYTEGIELAEKVREALDMRRATSGGIVMRACMLTDSNEYFDSDAYVQSLTFNIKI